MVWNSPSPSIEKPCPGKCTLIGMNAGLEFADGSDANTDQKMWLHHVSRCRVSDLQLDTDEE